MRGDHIKILVVEDDPTMRKINGFLLKQLGYTNTLMAADGVEALKVLKQERVDLVISDWNMPNMTGLELLLELRAEKRFKDTPFLMITVEGKLDRIMEALQAKATGYLIKPITLKLLEAKLNEILDGSR